MKFRIRSLFVLITCVAIAIPVMPLVVTYIRSLRPADAVILVKYSKVGAILPTVERYAATLSGIYAIKRDDRTNMIIVTSRVRNCDANEKAITDFITQLETERATATISSPSSSSLPFWKTGAPVFTIEPAP